MKFNYLLFILITSLSYLSTFSFTLQLHNHYTTIAGRILNLNTLLKNDIYQQDIFRNINYYNNNKSICFTYNHKNNFKYLLKDKYTYAISFEMYKYRYLLFIKSKPITYNYTEIDIEMRRNSKFNTTSNNINNINNYKKIDNLIYKYIYSNIVLQQEKKEDMSVELFKYFNNY
jgi:hypothetical protein